LRNSIIIRTVVCSRRLTYLGTGILIMSVSRPISHANDSLKRTANSQ